MLTDIKGLLVLLLILGSSLSAQAIRDDMEISSKLQSDISLHKELYGISYEVNKGVITIEGEVKKFGDKALAERLATNIPGVFRVRNLIVIDMPQNLFYY
jgi:osmotically-inducible protein OsmY